jgi:hypothetical protein
VAFDIIVLVGEILQALFFIEQPLIIVKMKLGEGNNIFPIKPTFIFINLISFIIYDKRASINRILSFCRIRASNSNNYSNYFSNNWIHPNKERKMIIILITIIIFIIIEIIFKIINKK